MKTLKLLPLQEDDRNQFILDNQEAFRYGAMEEFGLRDNHFEEDGEIISRETIEESIDCDLAFRIVADGKVVGGLVIRINGSRGNLDLLFVSPKLHSKGIGYAAWSAVEAMFPEVEVWETCTPYFEKRNIHFYVNRCGFHIVEFFHQYHRDPYDPDARMEDDFDGMFRFEKIIRKEYSMDRVQRIQDMEEKLDKAIKTVAVLDEALEQFKTVSPEIEELIAYYESDLWREDFKADEEGKLPEDLKRGVLSEDGIYNLLTDYHRLKRAINLNYSSWHQNKKDTFE